MSTSRHRKAVPTSIPDRAAERFWAKVDRRSEDECWVWRGSRNSLGYGQFGVLGQMFYAHRLSYQMTNGDLRPEGSIDHICRNPPCVNPAHLRQVTHAQNHQNKAAHSNSTTGIRGVHWHPQTRKYVVRVTRNYECHYGGLHESIEAAEQAAIRLRNRLFTHNAADRRVA